MPDSARLALQRDRRGRHLGRDPDATALCGDREPGPIPAEQVPRELARGVVLVVGCLLYTSDAADDVIDV